MTSAIESTQFWPVYWYYQLNYLSHFVPSTADGTHLALATAHMRQARGPRGPEPCELLLRGLDFNASITIHTVSNLTERRTPFQDTGTELIKTAVSNDGEKEKCSALWFKISSSGAGPEFKVVSVSGCIRIVLQGSIIWYSTRCS